MEVIQIRRDMDRLFRILRVISWLDNERWSESANYNVLGEVPFSLSSSEKILAHWLTYITDRQMPYEQIWRRGGFIFSDMARWYMRGSGVDKLKGDFLDEQGEKLTFKSVSLHPDDSQPVTFSSRYPNQDAKSIFATLKNLDGESGRNLVEFISLVIDKYADKKDCLRRIAFSLHTLTYQPKLRENPVKILGTRDFETRFAQWEKHATDDKKRLWCALRDYKKVGSVFRDLFLDALGEVHGRKAIMLKRVWTDLPMNQLELPGDVWNNNKDFRDRLMAPCLESLGINIKSKMPKAVRELYTKNELELRKIEFYPEQFDITFDFVPRMCSEPVWKEVCKKACPFGLEGAVKLCLRGLAGETKKRYCPVAFVTCGYKAMCKPDDCPIASGEARNLCIGK